MGRFWFWPGLILALRVYTRSRKPNLIILMPILSGAYLISLDLQTFDQKDEGNFHVQNHIGRNF